MGIKKRRTEPPPQSEPEPSSPPPQAAETVDVNQVVAYNIRQARLLRGWTQEDLAARLEHFSGTRLTQAGISSIERAWDGERPREFDAQEILIYALAFHLPIIWFLLPPPGDRRRIQDTSVQVDQLYTLLLGGPAQAQALYERLRQIGVTDPTAAQQAVERITGVPNPAKEWSYKERRKEILLALLDQHADNFDKNIEELGTLIDHLRQVGLRGFIAETTNDEDFTSLDPAHRSPAAPQQPPNDETTPDDTSENHEPSGGTE